MSKPILIVRINGFCTPEQAQSVCDYVKGACPDYNSLVVKGSEEECSFQFEVFNVQDYPQIDFDQLKIKLETECQDNTESLNSQVQ
jgi:hypothetical protein